MAGEATVEAFRRGYGLVQGGGVSAPANTVPPAITGTLTQGSLLSASTGTWTGSPTYAYQWTRNGVDIAAATNSTYTLVQADTARDINCRVTATNAGGSTAQLAAAVSVPAPELVTNGTFDTVTTGWNSSSGGTLASVAGQLSLTNSTATFGYAWQRVQNLEIGVSYHFEVDGAAALATLNLGTSQAGGQYRTDFSIASSHYTQDFTTTTTDLYIALKIASNTISANTKFDNVTLKKNP